MLLVDSSSVYSNSPSNSSSTINNNSNQIKSRSSSIDERCMREQQVQQTQLVTKKDQASIRKLPEIPGRIMQQQQTSSTDAKQRKLPQIQIIQRGPMASNNPRQLSISADTSTNQYGTNEAIYDDNNKNLRTQFYNIHRQGTQQSSNPTKTDYSNTNVHHSTKYYDNDSDDNEFFFNP
jgi:hypothetical protein